MRRSMESSAVALGLVVAELVHLSLRTPILVQDGLRPATFVLIIRYTSL